MAITQPVETMIDGATLQQQAASILLERRKARKDLVTFASRVPVPGCPASEIDDGAKIPLIETQQAEHHVLILQAMQKCMATPHGRLMIMAPPGSAKSTYASVVAPTWYLSNGENRKVILASYGDDLARRHGRRTRQLIQSPETIALMQTELAKDSRAANEFSLTNYSEYIACGILTGITGNRANGIVIDDPVKGRQDADSQVIQDRTFAAYEDDLLTRLIPGGWVVIINTRWNERDLCGRILPETWAGESGDILCRDGNVWTVLCFQAECQTQTDPLGRKIGEMLWPEWFDDRHWMQFRLNRRTWSSLYQQIPSPAEGILFRKEDMATYGDRPEDLQIIGASDNAVTPDDGDWTEQGIMGVHPSGRAYLLDWWRDQVGPEKWIAHQIDMMERWKPICWFCESGQIRRATEGMLRSEMLKRNVNCLLEYLPAVNDKVTNAQPVIALSGMGLLFWPIAAWVGELQRQCLVFPAGSPDDGVDTLGLLGRGVSIAAGIRKVYPVPEELIVTEPIPIPSHWKRIVGCGKFLGWAWMAWDEQADIVYIYDVLKMRETSVPIQAAAVNGRGKWIPVAWPLDGYQAKQARHGEQLAQQYREQGVNMRSEHAHFAESGVVGERKESMVSAEAGIQDVLARMQAGKIKVFSHLQPWFSEFRAFHRKDGNVVDEQNEIMSAMRIGIMDLRNAIVEPRRNQGIDHTAPRDWFV